jgi:hypothetical protein
MTLAAEVTIPMVVVGLYRAQRPAIGAAGKWGALLYAYTFVFFTGTVIYALVRDTPNFDRLTRDLDPAMTLHGAVMVGAAVAFGYATARAGVLPRWTGWALVLGVTAVALTTGSSPAIELGAVAVRDVAFLGMGWAVLRPPSPQPWLAPRTRVGMILDTVGAVPLWIVTPLLRPWHMRWGATRAEVRGAMPGDGIVPRAQFTATRAITIDAPPAQVWPWISQLGYGRAGFYTYDLVDNGGVPSADRVLDEHQHLAVGDAIPMFHESHGLAIAYTVHERDRESMTWVHRPHEGDVPDSTWSWRLDALPGGRTRLVTRMKQDYRWTTPRLALFNLILMELGDFAMERRMLKGIKSRAERVWAD